MEKFLKEMSNQELWELFPIILRAHTPAWQEDFRVEKANIENELGKDVIFRINHIGSTSVAGLLAKPTVDILLEVFENTPNEHILSAMKAAGYIYSAQPSNPAPHMMFLKGYTERGFAEKVFHLHVRYPGDWDELYFRDYLLEHPEIAKEYGQLKEKLSQEYEHDRDSYTQQKTGFISRITNLAKAAYSGRYAPPL